MSGFASRIRGLGASVIRRALGSSAKVLPDADTLDLQESLSITRRMDYPKADIYLSVTSKIELDARLNSCEKEPETVQWAEESLSPGDVLFDIGANVGAYSLVASKFHKGKVKVFSFEPAFPTFAKLCTNVAINGVSDCMVPMQIALSDRTGLQTFNYQNIDPGGALHALGDAVNFQGETFVPTFVQTVLGYSIDDLVAGFLPAPTHIKLDVDSIELEIIRGARNTMTRPEFKSILVEVEEGTSSGQQIISLLEEMGLRVASKHRYEYGGTSKWADTHNYIFVR